MFISIDVGIKNLAYIVFDNNKIIEWKVVELCDTNASKANIIAHSHGTLYTRYAISNLGLGSKVASYTSLCGPHRGSAVADWVMAGCFTGVDAATILASTIAMFSCNTTTSAFNFAI